MTCSVCYLDEEADDCAFCGAEEGFIRVLYAPQDEDLMYLPMDKEWSERIRVIGKMLGCETPEVEVAAQDREKRVLVYHNPLAERPNPHYPELRGPLVATVMSMASGLECSLPSRTA